MSPGPYHEHPLDNSGGEAAKIYAEETPTETDIRRMKLEQKLYNLKERIYRIRELVNVHSRFDFDKL